MSINFRKPDDPELKPRIVVFGVGGAGGNAVSNMLAAQLQGVEFVVANTDAQALANSGANRRIQLGTVITQGLGAGSRPEIGAQAADASLDEIIDALQGCHMAFITAGMGGGTGTGAAPVIARAARDHGILTVGVVTKPFQFEGQRRMRVAEDGIKAMQEVVDTLIVIPNQNLFRVANEKTTFAQAFKMADEVLHSGVRGITDLMVIPGLMNLDFADVRTVMSEMGKAMMGTGEADGDQRAIKAAEAAISNPLLDDVSMKGARGLLIHITGGMDLTLFEVDEAATRIRDEVDPDANVKVGSTFDPSLEGRVRVSVVATGIDAALARREVPRMEPVRQEAPRTTQLRTVGRGGAALAPAASPVTGAQLRANPVRQMQHQLAAEATALNEMAPVAEQVVARQVVDTRPEEEMMLGGQDAPIIAEAREHHVMPSMQPQARAVRRFDDIAIQAEADRARAAALARPIPPAPEKPKGGFMSSIFGARKAKEEPITPPAPAPRRTAAAAPAAPSWPGAREAQQEAPAREPRFDAPEPRARATATAKMGETPSLFPNNPGDDQLDIPAFLRR